MGRIKRVFKSLILIILAMLSITIINTGIGKIVYADRIDIKNSASKSDFPGSLPAYITYEDLISRYNLLCTGKGIGLPGYGSTTVKSGSHSAHITDQGLDTGRLKASDLGGQTLFANENYTDLVDTKSKTYGYFTEAIKYKATPAEAYILANLNDNVPGNGVEYIITNREYTGTIVEAEAIILRDSDGREREKIYITSYNNSQEPNGYAAKRNGKYYVVTPDTIGGGDGNYSSVQNAWWAVAHVNEGRTVIDNSLAQEARHFEQYIYSLGYTGDHDDQIQDISTNDVERVRTNVIRNNEDEFDIKYQVKMEHNEAEVRFDSEKNKYVIGPFNVNYTRDIGKFGNRPVVDFAGIKSSTLEGKFKTKNSRGEVVEEIKSIDFGTHYNFVYEHNHQEYRNTNPNWTTDTDVTYPYPYDNEKFYIELDYLDDLVSLTNFKFDFHYLNGGGSYEVLHGSYLIIQWRAINTGILGAESDVTAYTQNAKSTLLNFSNPSVEWNLQKLGNIRKGSEEVTLKKENVSDINFISGEQGLEQGTGKITGNGNVVSDDGKHTISADKISVLYQSVKIEGDKVKISCNIRSKGLGLWYIPEQTVEAEADRSKDKLYFSGSVTVRLSPMRGEANSSIVLYYICLNKIEDYINDGNVKMKALKPTVGLTLESGNNPTITMQKAGFLQDEEYYQIEVKSATHITGGSGNVRKFKASESKVYDWTVIFEEGGTKGSFKIKVKVPNMELEKNSINSADTVLFYNACKATDLGRGPGIRGKDGALKLPNKLPITVNASGIDPDLGTDFTVDTTSAQNGILDGYVFVPVWGWKLESGEVVGLSVKTQSTIKGLKATIPVTITDKKGHSVSLTVNYTSTSTASGSGSENGSTSGEGNSSTGGGQNEVGTTGLVENLGGILIPVGATPKKAQPQTIIGDDDDDDDDDDDEIEIRKEWASDMKTSVNNKIEKITPIEVTVKLYKNGNATDKTVKLNSSNNWSYKFDKLPKKENGKRNIYTIEEIAAKVKVDRTGEEKTDIKFKVSKTTSGKVITIKNTTVDEDPDFIDINGEKIWDDNNDYKGLRPKSITIALYRNGVQTNKKVTTNANKGWKYEFKHLPTKDNNGKKITYTIKEIDGQGYTIKSLNLESRIQFLGAGEEYMYIGNSDLPTYIGTYEYKGNNVINIINRLNEYRKLRGSAWISDHTFSQNFWNGDFEIDLTTSIAGMVWDDKETAKKGEDLSANGIYKSEDKDVPLGKIEVRIWKVVYEKKNNSYVEVTSGKYARELADAYRTKEVTQGGSVKLTDKIKFNSNSKKERLYTSSEKNETLGKYKAYLNVPSIQGLDTSKYKVSYDVEFIYDGQTYEVTEYLATTGEKETSKKVEKFESISNSSRDDASKAKKLDYSAYKNDSYAIETYKERHDFDNKFADIHGYNTYKNEGQDTGAIDKEGNGKTKGKATDAELEYNRKEVSVTGSNDSNIKDNKQKRSESVLITKDNDGYVLKTYEMKARTSTSGLLLPYEDTIHIENKKDDIPLNYVYTREDGKYTYYKPINEYFGNINLGLVRRDESDVTVSQDLYKAGVVVNQDELTYKYNTLIDFEDVEYDNYLNMLLDIQSADVKYELGLYPSDFYYRSDVYKAETGEITKILYNEKKASELRLFASYRICVYNDSTSQDVSINRLSDYYDSTFNLVKDNISANIKNEDGITNEKIIAEPSYYRIYSPLAQVAKYKYNKNEDTDVEKMKLLRATKKETKAKSGLVDWKTTNITKKVGEGEGQGTYKKMYTNTFTSVNENGKYTTNELTLHPGEKLEIFVSFEVDHSGYNKIKDKSDKNPSAFDDSKETKDTDRKDLLGNKNSVAELSSYSVFYTKDSLNKNNNVAYKAGEISGKVDKDSAPDNINFNKTENITVGEKQCTVLSKEYFEDDTESAPIFRVYLRDYENQEREINGVVWEDSLTENVKDDNTNTKTGNGIFDNEENKIAGATVSLVEKVKVVNDGKTVEYEYVWPDNAFGNAIPNYTSVTMSDKKGNYNFKNFVSGNYVVRFEYGNTAMTLKYNGQDYKNTSYQTGIKNPTKDKIEEVYTNEELRNSDQQTDNNPKLGAITLNNEWHDLSNNTDNLTNSRVSDARDYEARRLDIISYSRTINNSVAEVLATADSMEAKKLYNKLVEKMFDAEGKLVKNYGDALKEVTNENEDLKKFVDSEKYKSLIAFNAMEANTSKLKIQIEESRKLDYGQTRKSVNGTFKINSNITYEEILKSLEKDANADKSYTVENIDFGIERRPDTITQLDKFLTHVQLQKNNTPILDANIDENGNITISQSGNILNTDKILSVSESNGVQGFKYVNIEEQYLRDTEVIIDYKIRVTNKSEVDYSSAKVVTAYTPNVIDTLIKSSNDQLVSGEDIKYGEYIGLYYYTHDISAVDKTDENIAGGKYADKSVRTTVDQLVDYVDPTTSFVTTATKNNYWPGTNTSDNRYKIENGKKVEYLKGLISDDSYTAVQVEENGGTITKYYMQDDTASNNIYISETKNNIAISNNNQIEKVEKVKTIITRGDKGEKILTYEFNDKGTNDPASTYVGDSKNTENKSRTINVWKYINDIGNSYKEDIYNENLTRELETINLKGQNNEASIAEINMTTSMNTGNGTNINDMIYDNLAEILVYSNSVGRRSMSAIPGNAFEIAKQVAEDQAKDDAVYKYGGVWNAGHSSNYSKDKDKIGEGLNTENTTTQDYQKTMKYALNTKQTIKENAEEGIFIAELDSDAIDFITFTEPTGLNYAIQQQNKLVIVMLIALVILAIGIIIITIKVVLEKTTDNITIESTKEE